MNQNWDDIIGQRQLVDNLKNAIRYGKISHAYLIQGERLSGKRMAANIFARALQCEAEDGEGKPCGKCRSCRQAMNGNHPDIIYVEHEKPKVISVNDIREQINADIAIKPYSGEHKVYIVDEAEKMNAQAQNAILKTLEEPPSYAVILLLAENAEAMLPTILSRCVTLSTKPVHEQLIKEYLMKNVKVPDYRAQLCASFARGNVGRAAQLASNEEFDRLKSSVVDMMKSIDGVEVNQMAAEAKRITEEKIDADDYLDLCLIWHRDVLLYKSCGENCPIVFKEELPAIAQTARRCSFESVEHIIHSIERARSRLRSNVNFDLTMELLLMDLKSA